MLNKKMYLVSLLCSITGVCLCFLLSCSSGPEILKGKKQVQSEEEAYAGENQEDQYQQLALGQFSRYEGEKFSFSYPSSWIVATDATRGAADVDVKNTVKETQTAAAVPNDYYLSTAAGNVINSEKYADSFILISFDYFEEAALMTWQDFFAVHYPDVVEEFGNYQDEISGGLEAVVLTNLSGIVPGEARVFLRQGNKFLDIGLYRKGFESSNAKEIFSMFVSSVSF